MEYREKIVKREEKKNKLRLEKYLAKLITPDKAPEEDYTYGQDLAKQIPEVIEMYKKDGFETNLSKYKVNLGRSQDEITDMGSRIEAELLDVLTPDEQKVFDLNKTLQLLNETFKK